jgi:hypothetical protein
MQNSPEEANDCSNDQGITWLFQYSVSVYFFFLNMKSHHWGTGSKISRQSSWVEMSKKNSAQQVDVWIYRDGVPSSPTPPWTFQQLKMDHYTVSKCWVPITFWCGVTSHKKKHLSYTTTKTKLHSLLYFKEPIMSSYAPDAPQPHIIFMIHFITTLPSMPGSLKVDTLL